MVDAPTEQIAGLYRRRIGDIVVTAISDGYVTVPLELTLDISPEDAEAIQRRAFQPVPPRLSINTFAIHSAGRVALVDTGGGISMGDQPAGRLQQSLRAAGIAVADIDTVILTHMHPDHSNGLTSPDGVANFPTAELVVAEKDVDHWHDDAAMNRASERQRERFFMGAREQIKPYQNRRRNSVGEVFPGVTAEPLPGHTPGHTGYRVSSGDESLLIWGDIVHLPDVQVARPEAYAEPDCDPAAAVAQRRRVFEMVAREQLLVAGMHMHFPGFLRLRGNAHRGYELCPEVWVQDL